MTFNELLSSLDQHALHTYFGVEYLTFSLCANQVFIFTTFCIKQGHEIKLQTWHLTINCCRLLPTISTMDYGSGGKTRSLKDRFWEERSSEVKVIDGRCQQIHIKFIYSRTPILPMESISARYIVPIQVQALQHLN